MGIVGSADRAVRVFISSTFIDMADEREELVKRVFPALRELCESRGVGWGEVDLRWGITEEQAAEGRVLPICLEEIRTCRPYFIGILGERYGWVPERIDASLIEQEPWLAEHAEKSVTELEIIHGVLADPEMAEHAFFYFRDPRYVERHPELQERPAAGEIEQYGPQLAERRAEVRRQQLRALKDRIRASGLPVRDGYPDPEAFGELVRRDLMAVVNQLFPAGSEPTPLARERALHDGFAHSRAGIWIGRVKDLSRLDDHAAGTGEPLVITGESGIGKSALLANWALRFEDRRDAFLVTHFIAASPISADWAAMLRRLIAELAGYYGFEIEAADDPSALRAAFADALRRAAARGRVVLVIDALDQLEDRDGAPDLIWLPTVVPANVRLILSSLAGRPLNELIRRGWPTHQLAPLAEAEREQLIVEYLGQYRKSLSAGARSQIAVSSRAANPLYLRVLLEELRLYGDHHTLEQRLRELLAAPDVPRLYELVLTRWEQDYERSRPGLVGDAMSLLWAARRGLSEPELLDLLGDGQRPLPHALWSPLALAAKQALTDRVGLNGFAHAYARAAVQQRYLPSESEQQRAHERLANYFSKIEAPTTRKLEELPWQYAQAARWRELHDLLADTDFTVALTLTAKFELRGYWAQVEAESAHRLVEAYLPVLEDPARYERPELAVILELLSDTGHGPEALRIARHLEQLARDDSDELTLGFSLTVQAVIADMQGDPRRALELHKQVEELVRRTGDPQELARVLAHQAISLRKLGDLDRALALNREAEQIQRQHGNLRGLVTSLSNQASIQAFRGNRKGALELQREVERICRELGDIAVLAVSLQNQAVYLMDMGDNGTALARLTEAEQLQRDLGNPTGIAGCLSNRAVILGRQGDFDGALALHEQAESIWRAVGDLAGLAESLGNRAEILAEGRQNATAALAIFSEAERIWRQVGNPAGLASNLSDRADVLQEMGDDSAALVAREEAAQLYRQLGQSANLSKSLILQAMIRENRGEFGRADELSREAESFAREDGDPGLLRWVLVGRAHAVLLKQAESLLQRDADAALTMYREVERIGRELDSANEIQAGLIGQALIMIGRGDDRRTLAILDELEELGRRSGDTEQLEMFRSVRADILARRGNSEASPQLPPQQDGRPSTERPCEPTPHAGEAESSAQAAFQLGTTLSERNDTAGAIAAYRRGLTFTDSPYQTMCAIGLGMLLEHQGDTAEAAAAYRRGLDSNHTTSKAAALATYHLAVVLASQRDVLGAVITYQQAIDYHDENASPRAALGLGRLFEELSDNAGAIAAYRQAIEFGDANVSAEARRRLQLLGVI